jgi:hypothetical protein
MLNPKNVQTWAFTKSVFPEQVKASDVISFVPYLFRKLVPTEVVKKMLLRNTGWFKVVWTRQIDLASLQLIQTLNGRKDKRFWSLLDGPFTALCAVDTFQSSASGLVLN